MFANSRTRMFVAGSGANDQDPLVHMERTVEGSKLFEELLGGHSPHGLRYNDSLRHRCACIPSFMRTFVAVDSFWFQRVIHYTG
jgi:hypothetical protein